ncbi:MAG TPA: hypothetical protein VFY10_13235 [Dehalococcoidia bacterium]|nr:hypothetical protein [Dehalococcoidia bacterium]
MAHVLIVGSQFPRLLNLLSLMPDDWNACTLALADDVFERAAWSATRGQDPIIVAIEGRAPLPPDRLIDLHALLRTSTAILFYVDQDAGELTQQLRYEGARVLSGGEPPEIVAASLVLFLSRAVGTAS